MPDVKMKGWSGNEFTYQNVPKVWLESADSTEETPVLVPYTYGEAVSKTVEPDFSAGDMEVPIADGELVTELTIAKPETLVPENVANGVNIAGVVGTYDGGGSGDAGAYHVIVIDYDGTVLADNYLDTGDIFTLPDAPTHSRLIFGGWSASEPIVNNAITVTDNDVMVGAMYHTASGTTEFDIEMTAVTGLTFTFANVLTGMDSINWGDGTTDSSLTHTYASAGEYTIMVHGLTGIANGSASGGIVDVSGNMKFPIKSVYFSDSVTSIGDYAFFNCYSLKSIAIQNSVTSIGESAIRACSNLKSITIPNSVTAVGKYMLFVCCSLSSVVIPNSVKSFDLYAFRNCYSLKSITIPNSVTTIGNNAFSGCYSLTHMKIPNSVTSIENSAFYNCYSLKSITIPNSVATIRNDAFGNCYSLVNAVIQDGVKSIGGNAFIYCYSLTHMKIPNSVTSIGSGAFSTCRSITVYDFSTCINIPSLLGTTAFSGINAICKILIPSALYDEWKSAELWSTYAAYMVPV